MKGPAVLLQAGRAAACITIVCSSTIANCSMRGKQQQILITITHKHRHQLGCCTATPHTWWGVASCRVQYCMGVTQSLHDAVAGTIAAMLQTTHSYPKQTSCHAFCNLPTNSSCFQTQPIIKNPNTSVGSTQAFWSCVPRSDTWLLCIHSCPHPH